MANSELTFFLNIIMKQLIKPIASKNPSRTQFNNSTKNQFTFPKASRFPKQQENDDSEMIILPSTLSKKSCTFGLGSRKPLISSHCKDSPSPDRYLLRGSFNCINNSLDYKRQTIKERELFYIKPIPGPGFYNPNTPRKRRTPNCIISKTKKSQSLSSTPHPGQYNPNYEFNKKHLAVNFSFTKSRKLSFIDEKIEKRWEEEIFMKPEKKNQRARSVDLSKVWRSRAF